MYMKTDRKTETTEMVASSQEWTQRQSWQKCIPNLAHHLEDKPLKKNLKHPLTRTR